MSGDGLKNLIHLIQLKLKKERKKLQFQFRINRNCVRALESVIIDCVDAKVCQLI